MRIRAGNRPAVSHCCQLREDNKKPLTISLLNCKLLIPDMPRQDEQWLQYWLCLTASRGHRIQSQWEDFLELDLQRQHSQSIHTAYRMLLSQRCSAPLPSSWFCTLQEEILLYPTDGHQIRIQHWDVANQNHHSCNEFMYLNFDENEWERISKGNSSKCLQTPPQLLCWSHYSCMSYCPYAYACQASFEAPIFWEEKERRNSSLVADGRWCLAGPCFWN